MATHLLCLSASPGSPEGSAWPAAVVPQSPRQKQKDEAGRAETTATLMVIRPLLSQVSDPTLCGQDGVTGIPGLNCSVPSFSQYLRTPEKSSNQ